MEMLKRQASKWRDQVAKQQQIALYSVTEFDVFYVHAVVKQFRALGYQSSDAMVVDEIESHQHQQIEKLCKSTRAGRDLQKDIIRAAEAFATIGHKHVEIGRTLSEDCYEYGGEDQASETILGKAAALYGGALKDVEKEHEDFIAFLSSQIVDPLRMMVTDGTLENARNLAQQYNRMRHEAETLAAEVSKRLSQVRGTPILENTAKVQSSEAKMYELKVNMTFLGKEAATALVSVESQQQRHTIQRLASLVEAEKLFHLRLAAILDDVEAEMITEKQRKVSALPYAPFHKRSKKALYFLAEAIYHFSATSEKELSLEVGDYVVVRQVSPSGWSEGECRGKAGWFPSAYVEKRDDIPPNISLSLVAS
ncbi:hypothetical protein OPV22_016768 [Ensete ventricosum]|uniref:SH3 domain-containing protein n=1 Tax=Ensete ventricosum TaxID=4639 RepID=A0AAV8QUQ2_ENSVE|nr:hypothetical protein OPV22_016768 [Ensete ventricosum]